MVSEAVGFRKPESSILELACRNLGVTAAESVFIRENPDDDINGAKHCAFFTVYAPIQFNRPCSAADAICLEFLDLPEIIYNF